MAWVRTSDAWPESAAFEPLSLAARWHYLCLIHLCARKPAYDGRLRIVDAHRASDVDNAPAAVHELIQAGLLTHTKKDNTVTVVKIDDHMPPPHMRDESRKPAQNKRKAAERARKAAAERDRKAGDTSSDVTRDTGTGRDGTGRAVETGGETNVCALCHEPGARPDSVLHDDCQN